MDADERDVFQFLKDRGNDYVNAREIARRAGGKRRFQDDPEWAKRILLNMVERGILESDMLGRYRVKSLSKKDKRARWMSPDIAKILEGGGVKVEGADQTATDDYYDKL